VPADRGDVTGGCDFGDCSGVLILLILLGGHWMRQPGHTRVGAWGSQDQGGPR